MRLVDLNVAIKLDNNEKVIDFLKNTESDIITLQESMRGIDNTVYDRYNNSKLIKEAVKNTHKYDFYGALWVSDKHIKNGVVTKDFGGMAEQGNEIISRYPIIEASNNFFHKNYQIFRDTTAFRKTDHARAVVVAIVEINNQKLRLLNIHGIWNEGKIGDERTIKECEYLLSLIEDNTIPTIVVGDFNLNPQSKSIKILNKKLTNLIEKYNIKSTRPTVKDGLDVGNSVDDYIFVNDKIKVNNFEVKQTDASDHYPLILDFELID